MLPEAAVTRALVAGNFLSIEEKDLLDRQMEARLSGCVDCLVTVVLDGMPLLSGKLTVSLAVFER